MRSITSTPQSPEIAAKPMLSPAHQRSVRSISHPKSILAIFTAARFTVAMITTLKTKPR